MSQQKSKTHRKNRKQEVLNFNLNPEKKNPFKTWLRVAYILWPVVSLLFHIPFVKKIIVNKFLGEAGDVYAKVGSIRLHIFRPECSVKNIIFKKIDIPSDYSMESSAELIKLSIERKYLWDGILVCDALINHFVFSFSKNKKSVESSPAKSVHKKFDIPLPVIIRQFNVTNSKVEYIDRTLKAHVDIPVNNIRVRITNLSTLPSYEELPVKAFMRANVYNGIFNAHLKANVHGPKPEFDLDAELTGVNMVKLNDFFTAYGNFDVNDGTLSFFTEVAGKDGKYKGYVKPVIQNLDIVGAEDKHDSFLHQMWERFVGVAVALVTNQREGELATKIPFEGTYKPEINVSYAIIETFVNAFVNALKPSIDNEINIGSVKGR